MGGPVVRDPAYPQPDVRPVNIENQPVLTQQQGSLQVLTQTQTIYAQQQNPTASGNSGQLAAGALHELLCLIVIASITGGGSLTFFVETLDGFSNWLPLYTGTAQSAAANILISVGMGAANNQSIGNTVRVRWVVTGTVSASVVAITVYGK